MYKKVILLILVIHAHYLLPKINWNEGDVGFDIEKEFRYKELLPTFNVEKTPDNICRIFLGDIRDAIRSLTDNFRNYIFNLHHQEGSMLIIPLLRETAHLSKLVHAFVEKLSDAKIRKDKPDERIVKTMYEGYGYKLMLVSMGQREIDQNFPKPENFDYELIGKFFAGLFHTNCINVGEFNLLVFELFYLSILPFEKIDRFMYGVLDSFVRRKEGKNVILGIEHGLVDFVTETFRAFYAVDDHFPRKIASLFFGQDINNQKYKEIRMNEELFQKDFKGEFAFFYYDVVRALWGIPLEKDEDIQGVYEFETQSQVEIIESVQANQFMNNILNWILAAHFGPSVNDNVNGRANRIYQETIVQKITEDLHQKFNVADKKARDSFFRYNFGKSENIRNYYRFILTELQVKWDALILNTPNQEASKEPQQPDSKKLIHI